MYDLIELGKKTKLAKNELNKLLSGRKNEILNLCATYLISESDFIISENKKDLAKAIDNNLSKVLIDRLTLNTQRIQQMADGLFEIAKLNDPIGEVFELKRRPNGLMIGKKRVPLGSIGIIYESRPNVTADAFAICFKSSNTVILRGGKEAINSNLAIVKILRKAITKSDFNPDVLQIINDTSRETANRFMKLNTYIDVLIPRGGTGLINAVVENSTVPVIETGVGNCHIYVNKYADFEKAVAIIINAKTQRLGVCNAAESIVIDRDIHESFLPIICNSLRNKSVEIRGDKEVCKLIKYAKAATNEDWGEEYLDNIISIKIVDDIDSAITHIEAYSTKHSEAIISENYSAVQQFFDEVDSAAVYANASTRFTDGQEFGYGAEIGISTQKIHARGPMGINELTSIKYIIYGNGQVRN